MQSNTSNYLLIIKSLYSDITASSCEATFKVSLITATHCAATFTMSAVQVPAIYRNCKMRFDRKLQSTHTLWPDGYDMRPFVVVAIQPRWVVPNTRFARLCAKAQSIAKLCRLSIGTRAHWRRTTTPRSAQPKFEPGFDEIVIKDFVCASWISVGSCRLC